MSTMSTDQKIQAMHDKCSKLTSDDLILLLVELTMYGNIDPRTFFILKTYLARALRKEGIL